ncbi:unnamed protein product [Boreogadus saida]
MEPYVLILSPKVCSLPAGLPELRSPTPLCSSAAHLAFSERSSAAVRTAAEGVQHGHGEVGTRLWAALYSEEGSCWEGGTQGET